MAGETGDLKTSMADAATVPGEGMTCPGCKQLTGHKMRAVFSITRLSWELALLSGATPSY